ncbi:MAG: cytochrome c [Sphingobacteriaceae bacterium]|nr:cytochrome c [Cytophagaceae bacterium]
MSKVGLFAGLALVGWLGFRATPPELFPSETKAVADSIPVRFGFGQPATDAQIARLDLDVRPDGLGLPAGSGTATTGATIFAAKCAPCHGTGGTGGPNGALVTTTPAPGKRAEKVIGNYWPYATTVFDYIRRAMPFNAPGSLSDDEVYALTAYLLTANKILPEKTVLNAQMLPKITMPAQPLFVPDDRKGGPEVR